MHLGIVLIQCSNIKTTWYGRESKRVNKFFPSSKMCNTCGHIKENLKLSDRIITCKGCDKYMIEM